MIASNLKLSPINSAAQLFHIYLSNLFGINYDTAAHVRKRHNSYSKFDEYECMCLFVVIIVLFLAFHVSSYIPFDSCVLAAQ